MVSVAPDDLDLTLQLYAVALGDDGDRILFVKRTNPRSPHRAGRLMMIGRERLEVVDVPTFAFSADFDFVIGVGWTVVLNQRPFEILFRDVGLVALHIDTWISGITDYLGMDETSVQQLRDVAMRDSRTWRKLRDIERRGHLKNVEMAEVKQYANRVGLDPDKVVVDDKLVFDPAQRFSFLHLLNEDLYRGDLTDTVFEAQRKSATTG